MGRVVRHPPRHNFCPQCHVRALVTECIVWQPIVGALVGMEPSTASNRQRVKRGAVIIAQRARPRDLLILHNVSRGTQHFILRGSV
jgi:hypothetical protein